MALEQDIDSAIENATKKVAQAKTIDEAQQWQGIINQQLEARRQLLEENTKANSLDLDE